MSYRIKNTAEIEMLAEAGRRLAQVLEKLCGMVRVGIETRELDVCTRALIKGVGAVPAFLGYRTPGMVAKYPAALCVSVNDEVVHGIPSNYTVRDGDVVKIDVGLKFRGWYADSARTVIVGNGSRIARRLVAATEESLAAGIAAAIPGGTLGDVGAAISSCAMRSGFSIAEQLTGHGIGRALHEDPAVCNVGAAGRGEELVAGMVLAIEPMITAGSGKVKQLPNGTFVTIDGSLAAHAEHTVAITEQGPRILTIG